MIRFVGLDVHKRSTRACIRDPQNGIVLEEDFGGTRQDYEAFARKHLRRTDIVALEATFHAWAIVDVLTPFVSKVVVSNPLATKAIAESKIKTDKIDARVISELLRCDYLPTIWIPSETTRELRKLCARRASLVSDIVRIKNRIHGVLAANLIELPEGDLFGVRGRAWLASVGLDGFPRLQLESDLRQLALAEYELKQHDEILVRVAWKEPRVKLLMTIPGVDVTVALALLAALGEVERFPNPRKVSTYLGLVPSTHQSGKHCYHGSITKRGNAKARWLLIQAAQHMRCNPGPLGVFFRRIAKRKNHSVSLVATARKLAVIAWHMLTNNEPYRYAEPRLTSDKLGRLRVKATAARRKTGPKKGATQSSNRGTGIRTRTIAALAEVYASEALPPTIPLEGLKRGELRMLDEHGVLQYVTRIQRSQVVPKNRKAAGEAGRACEREAPRALDAGAEMQPEVKS